jgi:hypothetical protein
MEFLNILTAAPAQPLIFPDQARPFCVPWAGYMRKRRLSKASTEGGETKDAQKDESRDDRMHDFVLCVMLPVVKTFKSSICTERTERNFGRRTYRKQFCA